MEWLKQFNENYEGKSKEHKEIENYTRESFKGDTYIPWATMERLTYMQDPNATFETILTEDGKMIFSETLENYNKVSAKGEVVSETIASMMSHFVKVKLTFLGKVFVEEYPIQDQDYSPLRVYNQNAVNKSLKRALAKVASRATGLGLKLYENKDLQFDIVDKEKKPEVKKTTEDKVDKTVSKKVVEEKQVVSSTPVEEPTNVVETTEIPNTGFSDGVVELCNMIKTTDKDKMNKVLQSLNVAILKQHNFKLSIDDTDEELCNKLAKFKDISVFKRAITNMLGV